MVVVILPISAYNNSNFLKLVLTHLFPMHPFSTPWKHQKILGFLMLSSQGIEKGCIWNEWVNPRHNVIQYFFLMLDKVCSLPKCKLVIWWYFISKAADVWCLSIITWLWHLSDNSVNFKRPDSLSWSSLTLTNLKFSFWVLHLFANKFRFIFIINATCRGSLSREE